MIRAKEWIATQKARRDRAHEVALEVIKQLNAEQLNALALDSLVQAGMDAQVEPAGDIKDSMNQRIDRLTRRRPV